ncbi:MAG: MazG family protein [Candidatus Dormibacteria bacterium]
MTDADLRQLGRLFEVMEQLRAPGGCPWDRAQTHRTLLPFLLEETYETIQAAEQGDPGELAEELGDLLTEVAMQTAIASEAETFGIGTVARIATEKMIGRHPHVFSDLKVEGVTEVMRNWEELKRQEKPERESALDGIPATLPALALAAAVQRRQTREAPTPDPRPTIRELLAGLPEQGGSARTVDEVIGELLFQMVTLARQHDVDAEGALRRVATLRRETLRRVELDARSRLPTREGPADRSLLK